MSTAAMVVVGIIAYLNPDGSIAATHSAVFSSVEMCQKQAPAAIAQDMESTEELKGTHAIVQCWDTSPKKSDEVKNHVTIPQSEDTLQVFPFFKNAESIQQRA